MESLSLSEDTATSLGRCSNMDVVTAKILSEWEWKSTRDHQDSSSHHQSSSSPESSFDSMCSSPEMSSSSVSGGHHQQRFKDFSFGIMSEGGGSKTKPKMSMKRRVKASEREKMRMRSIAEALHHLRDYLPPDYSRRGQPLTKIQTLKYTIEYINKLSDIVNHA